MVIQLLVPNASFVGHLAGILVGLAYVYGPLRWLVNAVMAGGCAFALLVVVDVETQRNVFSPFWDLEIAGVTLLCLGLVSRSS